MSWSTIYPTTLKSDTGSVRVKMASGSSQSEGSKSYVLSGFDGESNTHLRYYQSEFNDYAKANAYYKLNPYVPAGGCTSVLFGAPNLVLRNYDWQYDNMVNFVVESMDPAFHSSIGVACQPDITSDMFVCSDSPAYDLSLLPFFMLDGVNEYGLYASMNVVPLSADIPVATTVPTDEFRDSICSMMVVRYILDHFTTATEAVDYLSKYVEIYQPKSLIDQGFCLHYHIVDKTNVSLVLEFNGSSLFVGVNHIVTNFYQQGVTGLSDVIPTPYSYSQGGYQPTSTGLKSNSQGLERYNLCFSKVLSDDVQDLEDALDFGEELYYSNLYNESTASDIWYSELSGINDLTIDSDPNDFESTLVHARDLYNNRNRSFSEVWITRHSCVYDLNYPSMVLRVEELDYQYFI